MTGRLLLLRHGETEWSRSGQHTGATDIALTAEGEQQARAVATSLAARRPVRVLTSPRQRARVTATLAGFPDAEVDPDLAEWDYGDYEGLTREQIHERDPGWAIWTSPTPGGETAQAVVSRADAVLTRIRPDLTRGDVLVISHGHFSRVLAVRWLEQPLPVAAILHVATASLCVLDEDRGQPILAHWNLPR